MTPEQFKELMEKLDRIQRSIDEGKFFQPRTYPMLQPWLDPQFVPSWPRNLIVTD